MANSGDPSTFTFTIDAFPAYTKFNKRKKVMAALQIIDPTVAGHNYEDKSIIGHENRNAGVDIYGEGNELTEGKEDQAKRNRIYDISIFDEVEDSNDDQDGEGQGGNGEGQGGTTPDQGETTTKTYVLAEEYEDGVTYYADENGTPLDEQPTADTFTPNTYYKEQA